MRAFKPVLKDGFARLNKEDAESAMPACPWSVHCTLTRFREIENVPKIMNSPLPAHPLSLSLVFVRSFTLGDDDRPKGANGEQREAAGRLHAHFYLAAAKPEVLISSRFLLSSNHNL